ncbi:MAG: DEAD/DEAH box helicase [Candidatus Heimdallarchaeota archaeon]
MSLEICNECAAANAPIYRCSKCSAPLCRHNVRTHVCSSPNLGLRGDQSPRLEGASISEEAWQAKLRKTRRKPYEVRIENDLSFLVEFPWYPFTKINAWIPSRRPHYKSERSRPLNVQDLFLYLEKETTEADYERKFFYRDWVEEQFSIWQRNFKSNNGYWENDRTHRPTKFELAFPQLAFEDLAMLRKAGVKIIYAAGVKRKLEKLARVASNDFLVTVKTEEDRLQIHWNENFNTWFHSLFNVFARYMAVRSEDDPDADYLPCIRQTASMAIEIDYWAAFRGNYFWKVISESLRSSKRYPLFKVKYSRFKPPKKETDLSILTSYTLRSYQKKAMEKWVANDYFGTIQLPTGSGKTLLGIDAIQKIHQRTLILVPNLALVDQWVTQLRKFLQIPVERVGIFNGQKKAFRNYPVVISTYQLLAQYLQDYHAYQKDRSETAQREEDTVIDTIGFFTNRFGLLIADESHHIQAETFRHIAVDLEIPKRMALSATIEKSIHSSLVVATMGPIVHKVSYGLLAREGFIAPIYYKLIHIPLTEDEKRLLQQKGKKIHGRIAREAQNKLIALETIIGSDLTSSTLVFTSRIKHAEQIHSYLEERGLQSTLLTGNTVVNDRELNEILQKFREGEIPTLVLVKMLNEGFDAPADTIIVVSGTRNRREQIQRFGRATRPGKTAKLFELVIDPMELDYEYDVAKARDISDIIEPHVQDTLLDIKTKNKIDNLLSSVKTRIYHKDGRSEKFE